MSQTGLTSAEVAERKAAGKTNAVARRTSRSATEILRANVFTWFNLILGVLWVLTISFGSWRDSLFGLVLVFNTAIGTIQELRAKATLDRLSLISAPGARVMRDGAAREIPVGDVVLDDVLLLSPGEQIVADGAVLETAGLEVDESALTGESVPVAKAVGDAVMSGSFVVAGSGAAKTTAVGADAYAMRLETQGRKFTRVRSEVMDGINRILKWIGIAMVPVAAITVFARVSSAGAVHARITDTVAALVSMVPEGLVLLSSIAFALSAVTLARKRVLVNELQAVEGLARVDVLMTDKTGTLTAREPAFSAVEAIDASAEEEARAALGAMAASDPSPNSTLRAIAGALGAPEGWAAVSSVPFSSARKWSAADFRERGAWALGAPEVVLAGDGAASRMRDRAAELAAAGTRVLALARTRGRAGEGELPPEVEPVALVLLEEHVRDDAPDTVRFLLEQEVSIRIISGDNPRTVSRVATLCGVPGAEEPVDARDLVETDALRAAMEGSSVFGRVMPDQKQDMVSALQAGGHTVAMSGDGVNDVLALKQADLGIAMGSGVPAARAVAQMVLLDDRFATMPLMMAEGRRVIANAERVANLFLTKSVWAMLLAITVALLGVPYPFLPRHITLVGSLAIGIPGFFFAMGGNARRYRPGFVPRVLSFAGPAGAVIAIAVLAVFLGGRGSGIALAHTRTLATLTLLLVSLAVMAVLEWPLSGARLAVVSTMAASAGVVFAVPFARNFFDLTVPTPGEALAIAAIAAIATALIAVLTTRSRRTARAGV